MRSNCRYLANDEYDLKRSLIGIMYREAAMQCKEQLDER